MGPELFYAIVDLSTGKLETNKAGAPRLWKNLRGPSQLLGKKTQSTETHKLVKVTVTLEG